jgi:hypothetical protein
MNWGVNEWVAVISALLAMASLVLNWLVVRRQTELQYETLRAEMDSEVLAWTQEAIDAVSDGVRLARCRGGAYAGDEFHRLAGEASHKLSSLADRGRLFFPNDAPSAHGVDKESAFQGYRPPILDAVVFASALLDRLDPNVPEPDKEAAAILTKCRRLLVSEAQNAIDPRRKGQMLKRLAVGRRDDQVSAYAIAAELGEAMEARFTGYLLERRDAAWIARREELARRG